MYLTVITKIATEVRKRLEGEGSGHDWWHVWRVVQMARRIGRAEGANLLVVELAALLHDIADWKFHKGNETMGPKIAREILSHHGVPEEVIQHVCAIIPAMSFKGARVATPMRTREGKIVQDADRLDAIGAIGIARTFAYGGYKHRMIWNPKQKPVMHASKKAYFANTSSTVSHFYEKLLLLKDRMNTRTAKKIASDRHRFMKDYLQRFFKEWKGKA